MTKPVVFDLLIVYTQKLALSAGSASLTPFRKGSNCESYNTVYAYFLANAQRNHLKVAFTTSKDISGPGLCSSFWTFKRGQWLKTNQEGYSSQIFDKFSPTNQKIKDSRDLLFSKPKIKPFNQHRLFNLFFDKQKAYDKLAKYSIPTSTILECTKGDIQKACQSLKKIINKHPDKANFSDELIIKDRFGAGGLNVFKTSSNNPAEILKLIGNSPQKSFIIQPFINFNQGYSYQNLPVSTDIRIIYLGGKVVQTYLRMAKKGDFRCNEHQGGLLKYIPKKDVPQKVLKSASQIAELLNQKNGLFALDFIISNTGVVYLLEGNTGPGLDWNLKLKENEIEAKKLIREIVKAISNKTAKKPKSSKTKLPTPFLVDSSEPITFSLGV